ncbi:MAG: VWA domain-containing protein [Calditrichaeota bacterium]|nr:VWA domain-containing protein [Calditrichota bacterium]
MIRGISFGLPYLYFLLGALLLAVVAFLVNKQTLPPVSVLRRRILFVLRALALMLILFFLFEPVVGWTDRNEEHAKVLLLVDRSASLALEDKGVVRDSAAKNFLREPRLRDLERADQLRVFAFGDSAIASTLDSVSTSTPSLIGTNPADGWSGALREVSGEDIGAIVLVSDGAQNSGPSPERVASTSGVPIFTVGVGDTTQRKDLLVAELFTNDVAYAGSSVPVRVRVRATGLSGQRSRLRIVDSQSRTLLDQELSFSGNADEQTFEAQFAADRKGDQRVTAILDSVPGELTAGDNRRSRIIRVLDSRFKVLVLAGAPSADLTSLLQTMGHDTTLEVTALVESKIGFIGGGKNADEAIENADLFVLVNYPTSATPEAGWNSVANRINRDRIPMLILLGEEVSGRRLERIADRLPVELSVQSGFSSVILKSSNSHAALSSRGALPADWSALPPVLGAMGTVKAKPFAVVAAEFVSELTPELPGSPALILSDVNRARSVCITVHETFRWKLGMAKHESGHGFYSELLSRLSSWLLAPTDEQLVKISSDKKVYSEGETVRLQGQVYGEDLAPEDNAKVLVEVSAAERTERIPLIGRGNGLYEGEFVPWGSGDYSFTGSAVANEDTLGKDRGSLVVEAFNPEWLESRARYDVLAAIAKNSGGLFVTAENPDSLFSGLELSGRVVENSREIPLWNRPLLLWILIGLLAVEWLLRKRSGML